VIVYRKPGLTGLEIWSGVASCGATLQQLRYSRGSYFAALSGFLERLRAGEARTGTGNGGLDRAAGFEHAVFCGGGALNPSLDSQLRRARPAFSYEIDSSGPYAAARGAAAVAAESGWERWTALDLGQTQLKVVTPRGSFCLPRDTSLLPYRTAANTTPDCRRHLRDLLRSGLDRARPIAGPPDGVVLGLPVEIDAAGRMAPATYPGLEGGLAEVFDGLFETPVAVLNDAVLAARGFPPQPPRKTLVLTLGFGVGAALWE
jgi:hypothetical protein